MQAPSEIDWPPVLSPFSSSPELERRIEQIISGMTLAQKVGQMTQPEIQYITPDEVRRYYIGSVLNGGGSWPAKQRKATAADWLNYSMKFHQASMSTDMAIKIPLVWGTDAVHGHNNVLGATAFPHNIGLGAANDPELTRRIGQAVGRAVRATGIDWTFAPTLAVTQDDRWGRTYESFSEDPQIVKPLGRAYVDGLQGDLRGDASVLATAKHFIGDGGTEEGKDHGPTMTSEATLARLHGAGYVGALEAGVQTVMASFNSWYDVGRGINQGKVHGSKWLLDSVLKSRLGFDGFVVSDWNGIEQIPGCSKTACAQAINAGIDMVMVPEDWRRFIADTIELVENGKISMSRVDDAVRRILRVKLRAGLFDRSPADGLHAGNSGALLARDLARDAVRRSMVLLKNNDAVLPFRHGQRLLIVGKSAHNISNQSGGWTISWQGTGNVNEDFPHGQSILDGIREIAGAGNVIFSERANFQADFDAASVDAVVAVIGELPYAEMVGDIGPAETLHHASRYPDDLRVLEAATALGKPVVTVFVAGRPLYVNDLLNRSNAFVMAWLPGTEGGGVADMLFAGRNGLLPKWQGRLPFSWPRRACQTPLNVDQQDYFPLFPLGYGLGYPSNTAISDLPVDIPDRGCGNALLTSIFNQTPRAPFRVKVGAIQGAEDSVVADGDPSETTSWPSAEPLLRVWATQINTQQDARRVAWTGAGRIFAHSTTTGSLSAHLKERSVLRFDMIAYAQPTRKVTLEMACDSACGAQLDLTKWISSFKLGEVYSAKIPLRCFVEQGVDLSKVVIPFSVATTGSFDAAFSNIFVISGQDNDSGVLPCAELLP